VNYIQSLQESNAEKLTLISEAVEELTSLMAYLQTPKFHGTGNDYVQISTDIFPRLRAIRMGLLK
jgi:hypothetical protein